MSNINLYSYKPESHTPQQLKMFCVYLAPLNTQYFEGLFFESTTFSPYLLLLLHHTFNAERRARVDVY